MGFSNWHVTFIFLIIHQPQQIVVPFHNTVSEVLMRKLGGKKLVCLTGCCLIMAGLQFTITGCSHGSRDEYARELTAAVDKIYANLEQYRKDPFKPLTNEKELLAGRSSAEIVALSVKEFLSMLNLVKYPAFKDIQDEDGYEAWATATDKTLRQRADKCLAIIEEIKLEYKKNPDGAQYKALILGTQYRVVWVTPEGRLWFATAPVSREGVFPEALLRANFRSHLDGIHNQDKKK